MLYILDQRIRYTLLLVLLSSVDASNCPHHLCLVVYHFPAGFTPTLASHGNAKEKKPYYPTWPSTLGVNASNKALKLQLNACLLLLEV